MGIKHFFPWFSKKHSKWVSKDIPEHIDTLSIDLNGIFHPVAQRVFQYGDFAPLQSMLRPNRKLTERDITLRTERCFKEICDKINWIVNLLSPKKRIILCIDGVAPFAKQKQQRERRFRYAAFGKEFDSCAISTGTVFMHKLDEYLHDFIHRCKKTHWRHLEIVYSSGKITGEGEHKCIRLMQQYCSPDEISMIYGMDCDLIMLCLASFIPNLYICRPQPRNHSIHDFINIDGCSNDIRETMTIPDYLIICFLVGNDFLPKNPSNVSLDFALSQYQDPLSTNIEGRWVLQIRPLLCFFARLEKNTKINTDKNAFYSTKLKFESNEKRNHQLKQLCMDYLDGLQWVLQYYMNGTQHWQWGFQYNYAPFVGDIVEYIDESTELSEPIETPPLSSFEQLLAILPPQSNALLPEPLRELPFNNELEEFYPLTHELDTDGIVYDWEAIVILPMLDLKKLQSEYEKVNKNHKLNKDPLNQQSELIVLS
jgi:5'-3' exonuclease